MDFSQISIYDFFVFFIILVVMIISLLCALLAKKTLRAIFFALTILLFLISPILNLFIIEYYINKVDLIIETSKKLTYTESYFLSGLLRNEGRKKIQYCHLGIYTKNFYPLQKPEFLFVLDNLNLASNASAKFEKMINNFKYDDIKTIKIRCF